MFKMLKFASAALLLFFAAAASLVAQREFRHPGGILSAADLERIRARVNAGDEPWASCWENFRADRASRSDYVARPSSEIGGSGGTRQRAAADAYAAMLNAVAWHVTGDPAHADCAARILTAWGDALETASAELFQYPCRAMIAAAEMLRGADGKFYPGWAAADRDRFLGKVRTVMYPACRKFCAGRNTHPSWYTPAAAAVLAAGVLLDDEDVYREGLELMLDESHWGAMFGGSIEPSGQMREMGRDNVHGGLTLCDIALACLFAWNQGDDLFAAGNDRLLKGAEYWCRYNTGHTDTPFEPRRCDGLDGASGYSFYFISTHENAFRLRPDACCFEAVFHHYAEVKGMAAEKEFPHLELAARLARPDSGNQMLGHGTLFFTVDPAASPVMTRKPRRPENLRAESALGGVRLSWDHPRSEDARGFRIFRAEEGSDFAPLATRDYCTENRFKDDAVEPGKKYRYRVSLVNFAGESASSDAVSARAEKGAGTPPKGWSAAAVGAGTLGGNVFSEAQGGTFSVAGTGADVGGKRDGHAFVFRELRGDGSLSARLESVGGRAFKVGLVMRASLSADAPRAGLTLGEKGGRMLRMCARAGSGENTVWRNGTNYGRAPLWMRMRREGDAFVAEVGRDGATWFEVGREEISMPETCLAGFAVCGGGASGVPARATFERVRFEEAAPSR